MKHNIYLSTVTQEEQDVLLTAHSLQDVHTHWGKEETNSFIPSLVNNQLKFLSLQFHSKVTQFETNMTLVQMSSKYFFSKQNKKKKRKVEQALPPHAAIISEN